MAGKPKYVLSEVELAAMVGISDTSLKAHRRLGAPIPKSRSDLPRWARDYHAWMKANGKGPGATRATAEKLSESAEEKKWKNEKMKATALLARLELERSMGTLIERETVVRFIGDACEAVRRRLNELPRVVVARMEGLDAEGARQLLQSEVDAICATFERGMLNAAVTDEKAPAAAGTGTEDPGSLEATAAPDGE